MVIPNVRGLEYMRKENAPWDYVKGDYYYYYYYVV